MILLSPHFTLAELIRSDIAIRKGIDNTPPAEVLENLRLLAAGLERVRDVLGRPVHISSGYRSPKLNAAVGGSKTSAHMQGLAADITAPAFGSPEDVVRALAKEMATIQADQIILEFPPNGWVHVGFPDVTMPRGQVLVYKGGAYERFVV